MRHALVVAAILAIGSDRLQQEGRTCSRSRAAPRPLPPPLPKPLPALPRRLLPLRRSRSPKRRSNPQSPHFGALLGCAEDKATGPACRARALVPPIAEPADAVSVALSAVAEQRHANLTPVEPGLLIGNRNPVGCTTQRRGKRIARQLGAVVALAQVCRNHVLQSAASLTRPAALPPIRCRDVRSGWRYVP